MKDAITTTSMTTTLHRTDERLVAEQLALCDALKALVHATKETDIHGHQVVAIMFTAVAEMCDAVCDPEDDARLAEDFSDILSAVRRSRA
jgi:hypothetical protein